MPEFEFSRDGVTVSVEFDVYCGTCGTGLCLQSEGYEAGKGRSRHVSVEACGKCIQEAANEAEAEAETELEELRQRISELEQQLERAETQEG